MKETIKKLKLIFTIVFAQFVGIAGIVMFLKKVKNIDDIIDISSKITVIVPIVMIASILIAYIIYDRIAKSSQKIEDEELQIKKYFKASFVKIIMLDFVGLLVTVMLFLLYQETYMYMLGIIVVFFLLNIPNEMKFKKDFKNKENSFFEK